MSLPSHEPPGRRVGSMLLRVLVRLVKLGVTLGVCAVLGFAGLIAYYGRDLPDVHALRDRQPLQTTRVLDRRGRLVGEIFAERRTVLPMEQIPPVMEIAVLAAEDANFYAHRGLDYRGIARAILRDILSGRANQGASTITQQVVKNVLLSPERTLARKVRELVLARRIEQTMTKREILALYLNTINFGDGRYGVEEAALYYFGKHARDLDLAEAALLAGLPQSPTRLNPFRNPEAAQRRQRYVLGQIEAKVDTHFRNHVTRAQVVAARDRTLTYVARAEGAARRSAAPEVMERVRAELRALVGDEAMQRGGFRIETTIDLELQQTARTALARHLAVVDERQRHMGPLTPPRTGRASRPEPTITALRSGRTFRAEVTGCDDAEGRIDLDVGGHRAFARLSEHARFNPRGLSACGFAPRGARVPVTLEDVGVDGGPARVHLELGPEGAVVVVDPRTRGILALVGSASGRVGFNRAVQARRQPGSTFKAFVYGAALRSRQFTPASVVTPEMIASDLAVAPVPDADELVEPTRLREALARSLNPVAVHLLLAVGGEAVVAEARNAGIESPLDPNPSLALGTSEVSPLELTNAYATLASGGTFAPAYLIERITGPDGRIVPLPARTPPRVAMSQAEAFSITSMLRSVVEEGTATAAKSLRRPIAGKTGTTNEARDAWFVGYTPRVVAGVWVGFDDHRPLGRGEEGARTALPVFVEVMKAAEGSSRPAGFVLPPGVEIVRIDRATGLLAPPGHLDALDEFFLAGTAPTEYPMLDAGVDAGTLELPPPMEGTVPAAPPMAPPQVVEPLPTSPAVAVPQPPPDAPAPAPTP